MAKSVDLPSRLGILPSRNKVLLPGAIIRICCTSPRSVKLVEQELWQKEEKGLIGILPVRDATEEISVLERILETEAQKYRLDLRMGKIKWRSFTGTLDMKMSLDSGVLVIEKDGHKGLICWTKFYPEATKV